MADQNVELEKYQMWNIYLEQIVSLCNKSRNCVKMQNSMELHVNNYKAN